MEATKLAVGLLYEFEDMYQADGLLRPRIAKSGDDEIAYTMANVSTDTSKITQTLTSYSI